MKEKKALMLKDWAEEDRPREKMLEKGPFALTNAELLGILIAAGYKDENAVDLAKRILAKVKGNLNELGKLTINDLKSFKGIGKVKAITIIAALELGRRRKAEEVTGKVKITSAKDVFNIFHPVLADLPYEELWLLLLNRSNGVIEKIKISQGGVASTIADIKIIVKLSIEHLASAVILVHNHPSGNLKAGKDDISTTNKLIEALKLFDIVLHDHIIVTDKSYTSIMNEILI